MVPNGPTDPARQRPDDDRPWAFLVSLGDTDDVASGAWFDRLIPHLRRLGEVHRIDQPESRLPYLAEEAVRQGSRPLHLAFAHPSKCYLTPAVPTILFVTWAYPDIPARDFLIDTRQNWKRTCGAAGSVVVPCAYTAEAFRNAGVACPVDVLPIPADLSDFEVPAWDRDRVESIECRHRVAGGTSQQSDPAVVNTDPEAQPSPAIKPWKRKLWELGRHGFHHVSPWLPDDTRLQVAWVRRHLLFLAGRAPGTLAPLPGGRPTLKRLARGLARQGYHHLVKRWLSPEALHHVARAKRLTYRLLRKPILAPPIPDVPVGELTLTGLVYACSLDPLNPRDNFAWLVTAFVFALRDRADATLVIRLTGPAAQRHTAAQVVVDTVEGLRLAPRCRVVVVADDLDRDAQRQLRLATTYAVSASLADGDALELRSAMAAGRPVIAPDRAATGDLIDEQVGFPVPAHPEPTCWPQDPERRLDTVWYRPVWAELRDRFTESADLALSDPSGYRDRSRAARTRMAQESETETLQIKLAEVFEAMADAELGQLAWA